MHIFLRDPVLPITVCLQGLHYNFVLGWPGTGHCLLGSESDYTTLLWCFFRNFQLSTSSISSVIFTYFPHWLLSGISETCARLSCVSASFTPKPHFPVYFLVLQTSPGASGTFCLLHFLLASLLTLTQLLESSFLLLSHVTGEGRSPSSTWSCYTVCKAVSSLSFSGKALLLSFCPLLEWSCCLGLLRWLLLSTGL